MATKRLQYTPVLGRFHDRLIPGVGLAQHCSDRQRARYATRLPPLLNQSLGSFRSILAHQVRV